MLYPGFAGWQNRRGWGGLIVGILLSGALGAPGADWPQYRGGAGDGVSEEAIATTWKTNSPGFVVWTNATLTNGFSSFAISEGRAFTQWARSSGGTMVELCGAVDLLTGTNLWATPIDKAPWSVTDMDNGGSGIAPYYKGDGPRGTPAVQAGRVFALSGDELHLVCLNATNGAVLWSNNLAASCGASKVAWENAASPRVDGDLIFVSLNTSFNNQNLAAFRTSDGGLAWSTQNETMTHASPVVATIEGVRQVIFTTRSGLVSLDGTNGAFLWKYPYPFSEISTAMGASPLVESNVVFCTASYSRGAAAARITCTDGVWTATHLYFRSGPNYRSVWMSPVCCDGYVYMLAGDSRTYLTPPLNCIELSTGDLRWSTNNFGMGGLIRVGTNLVVLTETGHLVLVQPNPNAYTELARYRAFQFTTSAPGKCWNSPAYSDGRIYARSTRGGIAVNVAPPSPQLRFHSGRFVDPTQFELLVTTTNGVPIPAVRLPGISVRASRTLDTPPDTWPRITNAFVLTTNGLASLTHAIDGEQLFYILGEVP